MGLTIAGITGSLIRELMDGEEPSVDIEPFRRHCLLHGLDDIGLTLEHEAKIAAYERDHSIAG